MPTTLTNGIQLPDKGSVDWYGSMQSNYNLIDTHLGNTDIHVTAEDKANWNSKQGSLSQAQLDAIAQVATNTSDIASLQSGKANASHTHSSSDITDIGDYATKQYVDNSISSLVDNAPDALNTLNELSAALNDDSNFASTVTTALAAKANSADLATVAISGSYTDLTDKPTINDSTITIQKNGSTVDTFTTNGSAKTINIPVPTKTSDITNDSNFVVSSSLANVATSGDYDDLDNKPDLNPYDQHLANTDIHVTAADKQKWNNGVTQAYVLRYSSTAITDNSTIAYSTLDNTDNIKADDKIIDVDGKIFSVVSVDSDNSTVTVGSALIDLALDANVVHKSGNETVGGIKTFTETPYIYNSDSTGNAPNIVIRNSKYAKGDTTNTGEQRLIFTDSSNTYVGQISSNKNIAGTQYLSFTIYTTDNNNANLSSTINYYLAKNGDRTFSPYEDGLVNLGTAQRKWKSVYATNYYYGNDNVEFSTKFVTTDTAQTISGNKTFSSTPFIYNSDTSGSTANLYLRNQLVTKGDTSSSGNQTIRFADANDKIMGRIQSNKVSNGASSLNLRADTIDTGNNDVTVEVQILAGRDGSKSLSPQNDNAIDLGRTLAKWKNIYSNQINGLTPSSLSLPSDRSARIDISGYFTNTGTGNTNDYSVPANGFIFLNLLNAFAVICYSIDGTNNVNYAQSYFRPVDGQIYILFPVRKNDTFRTLWTSNGGTITVTGAHFIPCLGNV